jgi:hypothetical protein
MSKHECQFIGCHRDVKHKETYKVLDANLELYSFTVYLCTKHFVEIHNFKEKMIGDFSVFFDSEFEKLKHF